MIKRYLTTLLTISLFFQVIPQTLPSFAASSPPNPETAKTEQDLVKSIIEAVRNDNFERIGIILHDVRVENIKYSQNKNLAIAWLVYIHPDSGEVLPGEPGLAIARFSQGAWDVILPTSEKWIESLYDLPESILSNEVRSAIVWMDHTKPKDQLNIPLMGYLLPWEVGKTVYLSRSLAHDRDIPSGNAHYSFDFYVPGSMFNIHAAKSGTVWLYKDSVPDNDHSDVNYIVLQDLSTVPTTYQLYLHLAQNSIPPSLRSVGAQVERGQFIGIADNTGQSTGHHLHFQVETLPHWSYWGASLDITFMDVDINGGRPRVPIDLPYCLPEDICEQTSASYISANYYQPDPDAPYGDITFPENGFLLQNSTIQLTGWAADVGGGNTFTRFKAYYDGSWKNISPVYTTSSLSYNWDLCRDKVEDGPVSVALEIQDAGGNWAGGLPGLHHMVKNFSCPAPPTCEPTSNQIVLYSDPDFQGDCALLGLGSHGSVDFGSVGARNTESVQIGSNVFATFFLDESLSGRGETIFNKDSNLSDNRIGADALSSVHVFPRATLPATPLILTPASGATITTDASFTFTAEDLGGSSEFILEVDGNPLGWLQNPVWHRGLLFPGIHTWRIKSRNLNGESTWSQVNNLTISDISHNPSTINVTAPFFDNMETGYNGWTNSSNWDQSLVDNRTPNGQISWAYEVNNASQGYDNGQVNSGYLTSPAITIPSSGFYLSFWYLYETEGASIHWDQRWVQISVDGSPFTNLYQLTDDPTNFWLQSPRTDLSQYAGSTIRIRFYFDTIDKNENAFKGWVIDDFSVIIDAPPECSNTGEPDDAPDQARTIDLNSSTFSEICSAGDIDFYLFTADVGDQIGVATRAASVASQLDTIIYLLDTDGKSILAMNDDQSPGSRTDSFLSYRIHETGTYFIKVLAWNHPSVGSDSHYYFLDLYNDDDEPSAQFVSPPSNTFLPNSTLVLEITGIDDSSGISHVEFFWHSGDWLFSDWNYLGSDWDGSDSWSLIFNTNIFPDQRDIAFYAKVVDWAGNSIGTGAWNLWLDRTPPYTQIQPIISQGLSNLFKIEWIAHDNLSGIDHLDIQIKQDTNSWADWLAGLEPGISHTWFTGALGSTFDFRMRGIDRIGNTEPYPSNPEVTITIPSVVCFSGDEWEYDNNSYTATSITTTGERQSHNFCNPIQGSNWVDDEDWFTFTAIKNDWIVISAYPLQPGSAPVIQLFDANATTLLAQAMPVSYGEQSRLIWLPNQDGLLYIRASHLNNLAAGQDLGYQISVFQGEEIFLPMIQSTP